MEIWNLVFMQDQVDARPEVIGAAARRRTSTPARRWSAWRRCCRAWTTCSRPTCSARCSRWPSRCSGEAHGDDDPPMTCRSR